MKIGVVFFSINDYGGILNHSDNLGKGLLQLGHEVHPIMLKPTGTDHSVTSTNKKGDPMWVTAGGLPGCIIHQTAGIAGIRTINYNTALDTWFDFVHDMDLIIYMVPCITVNKTTRNTGDQWLEVYRGHFTTQVAYIHDGNLQKLYPHFYYAAQVMDGVICVHDNAYNNCDVLPCHRVFIPNAHAMPKGAPVPLPMAERDPIVAAVQVFKRWKRVDDLVRAVPLLKNVEEVVIGGRGIEYYYMTSKEKTKPEYKGIWDAALASGIMDYAGILTVAQRDDLFANSRLMYDPSWSTTYAEKGSHFNRTMVEAMVQGCVPVCTDLAMRDSRLFNAGEHYLELPYDLTPAQRAKQLDKWVINLDLLEQIQATNYRHMKQFRAKRIAQRVVDFAADASEHGTMGTPTGKFKDDAQANKAKISNSL